MKAILDEDLCTNCHLCVQLCPAVFEDRTRERCVRVKKKTVPVNDETLCQAAHEQCPMEAIIIEEY